MRVLPVEVIAMRTSFGTVLAAAVLTLVVISAQEKPAGPPPGDTERLLIANERALYDAVAKGDRASWTALVLPDGTWTTKGGFIPMDLLASVGDGLGVFHLTKSDIVNPHVTKLGEDSAIVVYTWMGAGTFQNQQVWPRTLASTVWTKRNGKWLAVHHQETDLSQ
jgi:hypothetical protein